jgi:hypothetical protein
MIGSWSIQVQAVWQSVGNVTKSLAPLPILGWEIMLHVLYVLQRVNFIKGQSASKEDWRNKKAANE